MDYQVLARKWRPQVFSDVVGQEHVVKTLVNAISHDRIAHAFVFSGPRGVGKTSIARIMAKALNCEKGPAAVPCNECSNCTHITDGTSMDVREIDGASNRGIDEIRELRENVRFAPLSSRYKIYIIDEVHMLTREAFNALLKTLEEPPAHVIFIFATTETHKVPATILSRCQCYDFRRISIRRIAENLKKIATAESVRISDTGLSWIAEAGDGSLRDSQSIFDQVISYGGFDISDQAIEEILGRSDRKFIFALSSAVLARDAGKCLKIIEDAYFAGLDMRYFYQRLTAHFRNLLLVKIVGSDEQFFEISTDEQAALRNQVGESTRDTIQRLLDILLAEEESIRRSGDPKLNIEAIAVRMAYLEPQIPIDEILVRMGELTKKLNMVPPPGRSDYSGKPQAAPKSEIKEDGAAYEAEPAPAPAPPPAAVAIEDDPAERWNDFRKYVRSENSPLASKLEPGRFLRFEKNCFHIAFSKGYIFFDELNAREQKKRLSDLAADFFQREVAVKWEMLETTNGAAESGGSKASRSGELKRKALNHPLLKTVFDVFEGAEITDIITKTDKKA
ncbi:MAG: DNA polymerase III subunit gamma/tau [Smithellaceae bacterium]|nr:DNA polymerase III subunit gamma/tau [Smithellaceae bacterium]